MAVEINELPKKNKGISRIFKAGINSIQGIGAAFKHEEAFQQEIVIGCALLVAVPFLPTTSLESAVLMVAVFIVWIIELLNSGLEWTIDYISKERHPYAKKVKDMGSAAVFISLILLLCTWVIILKPYFL